VARDNQGLIIQCFFHDVRECGGLAVLSRVQAKALPAVGHPVPAFIGTAKREYVSSGFMRIQSCLKAGLRVAHPVWRDSEFPEGMVGYRKPSIRTLATRFVDIAGQQGKASIESIWLAASDLEWIPQERAGGIRGSAIAHSSPSL